MEHGFTWNALGILENNTISFKKKGREREMAILSLNIIKTAQPWR